ncbi:MAG: AAA family ATPase [Acidobacteriota bacterium]|nr:AAA family ATPase [Acidobacteriota bacterium]
MRIQGFRIDGFGRFADHSVGPLDNPLTLIYGPNEAGKSTYLAFIRTILFGFPRRLGHRHYPPLSGGRHGGSIDLVGGDGGRYVVHRVQGRGAGPVTVTGGNGEVLDKGVLAQLLGHHGRDVFESVFAFTLEDLHSGDLLGKSSVNSQIYSAGMGVTKLPQAVKKLQAERATLFLKGGSVNRIARTARKLDEVEARLRDVANNAVEFGRLTTRLQEVESRLSDLKRVRRRGQSRLDHRRQLQDAWEDWNDLIGVDRQLVELPVIKDFPVDGIRRLEALEERLRGARREYDSARTGVEEARAKTTVRIEHAAIVDSAVEIRNLARLRGAFDKSVRDLPKRQAELENYRNDLLKTIQELGPDWDEQRLEHFDLSLAVREEISEHEERLRRAREGLRRSESAHEQAEGLLKEASQSVDRAKKELEADPRPEYDADGVRRRRSEVRRARAQLNRYEREVQRASDLKRQLDGVYRAGSPAAGNAMMWLAVLCAAIGIVLAVAGVMGGGAILVMGVVTSLILIALAVYFLVRNRAGAGTAESPIADPIRRSLEDARRRHLDMRAELGETALEMGLKEINESVLTDAEESLDAENLRLAQRERLRQVLKQAKESMRERAARKDEAGENVARARARVDAARMAWRAWLEERSLHTTFTPEAMGELRGQIELGRNRFAEVRNWRQRIAGIREDIDSYAAMVGPLASSFDVDFDPGDAHAVGGTADALIDLDERVRRKLRDRANATTELHTAESELKEREKRLAAAESELRRLLGSGGATDAEHFRKRAERFRQRAELGERRREVLSRLQRISGPGERLDSLMQRLENIDLQSILARINQVRDELDEADKEIQSLSTERGGIRSDLDRLIGEEQSSGWRMERHLLLEQIRGHAREWVIRTLVQQLLESAQSKFEKERQPGVVRHAERFFDRITGNRYPQVYAPLGERTIIVTEGAGHRKSPDELSRGTREQLFLSLRFGLIRELGLRTEPLPVVVDEVLVNFDPDRALRAARAFVELSRTNQILVFTCHPAVVELFQKAAGEKSPDLIWIG